MRGPDRVRGGTTSCLTPERPALADSGGRVTMPFLPTLATVVLLATASLFCPSSQTPAPTAATRMVPASGPASLAMAEPALPLAEPAPRPPAIIAFSDVSPDRGLRSGDHRGHRGPGGRDAHRRPAEPPDRDGRRRSASLHRAPLPGHTRAGDPFGPAKPGLGLAGAADEAPPAGRVPGALPFAESVAEAFLPVAGTSGPMSAPASSG